MLCTPLLLLPLLALLLYVILQSMLSLKGLKFPRYYGKINLIIKCTTRLLANQITHNNIK